MNIKLFGYSISLNVLILIGILYLIMVVNALSASCNMEGLKWKKGKGKGGNDQSMSPAEKFMNELANIDKEVSSAPKPLSVQAKQTFRAKLKNVETSALSTGDSNLAKQVGSQVKAALNKLSSM